MKISLPNLLRNCNNKGLVIFVSLVISFVIYYGGIPFSSAQNVATQNNSTSSNKSLQGSTTSENDESSNDPSADETQTLLVGIFGTIVSAASASVAALTYRYQKKMAIATYRYQKKQYKLNALIQIFNLLSSKEHISARDTVRRVYESSQLRT